MTDTETTYSNRELDGKFEAVEQTSNDNRHSINNKIQGMQSVLELRIADLSKSTAESLTRLEVKTESIEAQTKKTNGRVSSLENWKAYAVGFCAAITVLILPVVFILFQSYLHI